MWQLERHYKRDMRPLQKSWPATLECLNDSVVSAGFANLNLHRVWATCDTRNYASYRVMEKLGMRREGLFKKDVLQKGESRDSYLYAVLAEEWDSAPHG